MLLDKYTMMEYNSVTKLLEVYDMQSGKLLRVVRGQDRASGEGLVQVVLANGDLVAVEPGVDISLLERGLRKPKVYTPEAVAILCQRVAEGGSVTRICAEYEDMPTYASLCRWKRTMNHIEEDLEMARRDRAEYLRDVALREAMSAVDKNDTPAQNLKYEANKWAAGVDQPGRYGQKNKVDVAVSATMLVVDTGIYREERNVGEINGENKVITEANASSDNSDSGDSRTSS